VRNFQTSSTYQSIFAEVDDSIRTVRCRITRGSKGDDIGRTVQAPNTISSLVQFAGFDQVGMFLRMIRKLWHDKAVKSLQAHIVQRIFDELERRFWPCILDSAESYVEARTSVILGNIFKLDHVATQGWQGLSTPIEPTTSKRMNRQPSNNDTIISKNE